MTAVQQPPGGYHFDANNIVDSDLEELEDDESNSAKLFERSRIRALAGMSLRFFSDFITYCSVKGFSMRPELVFTRESNYTALACLSHRNSVCLSDRRSVCLLRGWISQKRCKLGSPNFYHRLPGRLVLGTVKLFHKFEGSHPERGH